MGEYKHLQGFAPICDGNCRILILGTVPGKVSLQKKQYYCNGGNRFWKVIAYVTGTMTVPESYEDKVKMLLDNHIAVWDVLYCCDRIGSKDNTIKNAEPNNIMSLIEKTKIEKIYCNGKRAKKYFKRFQKEFSEDEVIYLSSSSGANKRYYPDEKLKIDWKEKIEI